MHMQGTYDGADQYPPQKKHKGSFLEEGTFIDLSCTHGQAANC